MNTNPHHNESISVTVVSKEEPSPKVLDLARFDKIINMANWIHYKTRIDSKHVHIGDFRDDFCSSRDKFVETFQGFYGVESVENLGYEPVRPSEEDMVKCFYECMDEFMKYLEGILMECEFRSGLNRIYQKFDTLFGQYGMLIQKK